MPQPVPSPDAPRHGGPRPDTPVRGSARPGPYVAAGVLVAIGIVLPLVVPIYARHDPELAGMPFFYWYQLLWVFIDAGLLFVAYTLMRKEDRRRRDVVRAQGSGPGGHPPRHAAATDAAGDATEDGGAR
ncbi:hypothetical protein GCM10025864_25930 [Luteimicrobium album]|uniref:DUF3311 domain-containing protein n=1 Tax=Luteimicrobium album TaxID=1054550 RepID=A0ABQ6I247_9MICO|nr:DUF3311 domain-containing protein [Luteimicrobium album]GMA24834.1 hypothetical protein GCM10025864_25930 [Luteimicrobium album]